MARPQRPTEVVDRLMHGLDMTNDEAIAARTRMLQTLRDGDLAEAHAEFQRNEARTVQRLREIDDDLRPEDRELDRRTGVQQSTVALAAAWREAGIREKVFALDVPRPIRLAILALLAMVDFYVFALAIAEAQEVAAEITEPLFLVGGSLGWFVFGVGFMLARVVKRAFYARAQHRMLDNPHLRNQGVEKHRLIPPREPEMLMMGLLAFLFCTLCVYAFAIRWQAMDPTENPNVIVFMSLIPLIGLAVELVMYDPSVVEPPRLSGRARRLMRQRAQEDAALDDLKAEAAQERDRINELYNKARALWEVRLADELPGARAARRNGVGSSDRPGPGDEGPPVNGATSDGSSRSGPGPRPDPGRDVYDPDAAWPPAGP